MLLRGNSSCGCSEPSEPSWIESGWDAGKPQPAKEAKFNVRYRVRTIEPKPPPPDPAEVRAKEFAAEKKP